MSLEIGRDTLFVTLAGSQAHGTARPGSDVDLRGVFLAPLEERLSLFRTVEQVEGPLSGQIGDTVDSRLREHPTASPGRAVKTECVLFEVAKFLSLCAAANPNALEILFAHECDWMYETPAWRRLHEHRRHFLTLKVRETYLGYALAQLKRIGTHRAWLLHPPARKPLRADFGLPEASTLSRDDQDRIEHGINERLKSYSLDSVEIPPALRRELKERLRQVWRDLLQTPDEQVDGQLRSVASGALKLPKEVEVTLGAERRYRAAMKHWQAYEVWKASRNPARAELERSFGYDTKHAMHLVRLMRSGLEILDTGDLLVRREDARDLSAIRDGKLSYEALLEVASDLQSRMEETARRSSLPADIDPEFVDGLLIETVRGSL